VNPVIPGSPDGAGLWLRASLDVGDIAGLLLEITVPKYAGGGAVFVLERLATGEPDTGGGQVVMRRLRNRFPHEGGEQMEGGLPAGEVLAFAADSPYARSLSGGGPEMFGQPDAATLERVRPGGRAILSRYTSFLTVPMAARGGAAGLLVLARAAGEPPFPPGDIAAVTGLAARAGASLADASEFTRRRLDSQALHRGLVAPAPALPARVEVAWRSLPAPGQIVGGDWWDIVPLPGERAGLIVGDVMEHGPAAAVMMAQLRAAAHALADLDLEPAEMMGRLDRSAAALTNGISGTCVYAVVDPAEGSCTMALAGHLPPVLALPDGRTHVPVLPAGMPVGLGGGAFGQVRIKLPPGAVLALYTDGLVESRTRSFEGGILALRSALAGEQSSVLAREQGTALAGEQRSVLPGEQSSLTGICDSLIESLRHREDDITVILARIPPGPARPAPARPPS
jgi:serine phosphatase RsbU (regulator of sigma subunit)